MNDPGSPTANPAPGPDFAAFGPVEVRPLTRMQTLVAAAMQKSWTSVPHVSHFEEADLGAVEIQRAGEAEQGNPKMSLLAFFFKAAVCCPSRCPTIIALSMGRWPEIFAPPSPQLSAASTSCDKCSLARTPPPRRYDARASDSEEFVSSWLRNWRGDRANQR